MTTDQPTTDDRRPTSQPIPMVNSLWSVVRGRWSVILAALIGGVSGLLLARLVLRLFAARPESPVVSVVLGVTAPLTAPLAWLDAGQPRFGATLELSTIVSLVVCFVLLLALRALRRHGGTTQER